MARLPVPGSDQGVWGDVLNEFLAISHKADGTLQSSTVDTAAIQNSAVTSQKLSSAVQDSLDKADTALQSAPVTSVATKTGAVALVKGDVGLGNVDNTADADKPISSATQTALNLKVATADLATVATSGSYNDLTDQPSIPTVTSVASRTGDVVLTKADVGLTNVDDTSDLDKPISTAAQTALDAKADATSVGAKVLLIDDAEALPPGTPAGVVVVVKV